MSRALRGCCDSAATVKASQHQAFGPAQALGPPAETLLQLAPRLFFQAGASNIVLRELLLRIDSAADKNTPQLAV